MYVFTVYGAAITFRGEEQVPLIFLPKGAHDHIGTFFFFFYILRQSEHQTCLGFFYFLDVPLIQT